ncbi:MAG: endospore germination permease [Bacillota bacterium]|nr:endospore germination permease [Bacillota bacterium]
MTIAKIDRMQYFFMIPNLLFGKAIGITAGVMVRKLGADTWLSMTIGFVIGIIFMLLMVYLCSKFPDKTVIEFSKQLLGKWVGGAIGVLLALFFIMAYATSANTMLLHLSEYFLQQTPFLLICILYILLCMYGVFMGIEVVVRFSLVGFIMSILINVTMLTGTSQDLRPINILPLMDKGLLTDITGSYYIFGDISMAILAAGFLYPMLNKKEKVRRITFWAMVTGACMIIVWPLFETMVLGPDLMKQSVVVCMRQIRCAQLTKYLPRYELIMVSFFAFGMLVQSVAMFYCAKHCIKQVAGIKKDWIMIIPLAVVLVIATYFMGQDDNNYIDFLSFPYSQICAALGIGLPLFLFFTALLRGKLKKRKKGC